MDSFGILFVYVILPIVAFILSVLFVRWVFKINDMIAYQKRQYMILRQIAIKLGVDEILINDIDNR
jgi:hypothetical protein